jgi:hypothetical protein
MDFNSGIAQRGLVSPEARAGRPVMISRVLWLKVAEDLWGWLIRYN